MLPTCETVRSKRPRVAVARYGAIGSLSRQTQVVRPPDDRCDTSTPFAITVRPSGTVTWKSKVALSCGVSLTGYQLGEPCGSPTTKAPSAVGTHPSIEPSGSVTTWGTPAYAMETVNVRPTRRPLLGVMTSSWSPARSYAAGEPFTCTLEMVKPRRSRSHRERFCVAVAVMTAVPVSCFEAGS